MSSKIPNPTETILGTFNERGDLLRQRAHADRLVRRLRATARVVLVLLLLVLAPFLLAGPPERSGGSVPTSSPWWYSAC